MDGTVKEIVRPGSAVTAKIPLSSWDKEGRQGNEPVRCPRPQAWLLWADKSEHILHGGSWHSLSQFIAQQVRHQLSLSIASEECETPPGPDLKVLFGDSNTSGPESQRVLRFCPFASGPMNFQLEAGHGTHHSRYLSQRPPCKTWGHETPLYRAAFGPQPIAVFH